VVLATGARTIIAPEAEGVRARCVTDVDLLEGKLTLKQRARALVFDVEGLRGGYAANFLAEAGASRIELVSPLLTVCEGLDSTNQPPMYRRLAKNNVVCTPNQTLAGEREVALIMRDVWSDQERVVEDVDLIVFAGIRVAMDTLTDSLYRAEPSLEIHRIGDCVAPRLLRDAVTEGVRAGNAI
jgi:dimethylglycine catabolism A